MKYDLIYKDYPEYFGSNPDKLLADHYRSISKKSPVLDIGAGQGRNSVFLAENGYKVEALDQSIEGIKIIKRIAEKNKLEINAVNSDFVNFKQQNKYYSAILCFGIIQELSRQSINILIDKINKWTVTGGYIFLTAFSTLDPSFSNVSLKWKIIGKNSYQDNEGAIKTYLEPNEVLELFSNAEIIYHREEFGPIHTHSDGSKHQHGKIEMISKIQ